VLDPRHGGDIELADERRSRGAGVELGVNFE
jgi:hypothetical protein